MANYTAQDVKKLREITDAPMMECKSALDEADGDQKRAIDLLREKGKVAAGKKADRSTSAGVVAFSPSEDGTTVGAVVVETETDFVSKNPGFVEMAQGIADFVRDNGAEDEAKLKELAEEIVAKFRENAKVAKAMLLKSTDKIVTYVHHDKSKGAAVISEGPNAGTEAVRKVAIHIVSLPPTVVSKDQLSQDKLEAEYATQFQRALNEGKPENIAKNIATGRVNKEFIKEVVLLEQPFYADGSKSVSQYLAEEAKGVKVKDFVYLAIGQTAPEG